MSIPNNGNTKQTSRTHFKDSTRKHFCTHITTHITHIKLSIRLSPIYKRKIVINQIHYSKTTTLLMEFHTYKAVWDITRIFVS